MFLRHGHWEEFDCDIGIEWLQNVFRNRGVVNTCIFVFVQLWQLPLSNVHHFDWRLNTKLPRVLLVVEKKQKEMVKLCYQEECQNQGGMFCASIFEFQGERNTRKQKTSWFPMITGMCSRTLFMPECTRHHMPPALDHDQAMLPNNGGDTGSMFEQSMGNSIRVIDLFYLLQSFFSICVFRIMSPTKISHVQTLANSEAVNHGLIVEA